MERKFKKKDDQRKKKDWRREYSGSKSFDRSCRNHGSCGWCENGRLHKHKRRMPIGNDYED